MIDAPLSHKQKKSYLIKNQVAYVRSTYNEDLEFLNFLLFNINDVWERYDEIEHLKNKFFNHEIKFEGIFKKQSNDMLNEYHQ